MSDGAIRRLARKCEPDLLYRVAKADCLGRRPGAFEPVAMEWFRERVRELDVAVRPPEPILKGRDVLALGRERRGPRSGASCAPSTSASSTERSRRSRRRGPRPVASSGSRLESRTGPAGHSESGRLTVVRALARVAVAFAVVAPVASSAEAGVKTEEKTQVQFGGLLGGIMNKFGGKAAKEGLVDTVAVVGDRKLTLNEPRGRSSTSPRRRSTTST